VSAPASRLSCAGCGASPADDEPYPFSCPNLGAGDVDHVLVRLLDTRHLRFPSNEGGDGRGGRSPFVRYRTLLHSYRRALAGGMSDEDFVELVRGLDAAVAAIEGHGFLATPLAHSEELSRRLGFVPPGGVFVKDETGNVAGSHKARHLMGVLLHLEVAERIGLAGPAHRRRLAIASCGNAALAAGVVAAAGGRRLVVFVPSDADPAILERLAELGARAVRCARRPGQSGDPAYRRLLEELERGALPFTCQGNLNGLAIEGGETLGYEIVSDLASAATPPDHLVVQVGGGALASSCSQAAAEAVALGALSRSPRIHTVQTEAAHPLERAYRAARALLPATASGRQLDEALRSAARNRSHYMWPWEHAPRSIATGILDDETYDWLAVVRGMLASGGGPLVVSEERLAEANELGLKAGFDVDPTGSAGLAGLLELVESGAVRPAERAVVLFTGTRR
jgi:threonine synthase